MKYVAELHLEGQSDLAPDNIGICKESPPRKTWTDGRSLRQAIEFELPFTPAMRS